MQTESAALFFDYCDADYERCSLIYRRDFHRVYSLCHNLHREAEVVGEDFPASSHRLTPPQYSSSKILVGPFSSTYLSWHKQYTKFWMSQEKYSIAERTTAPSRFFEKYTPVQGS